MKLIEKLFNKFGYEKKSKYEEYDEELAESGKPYSRNGVWYNVYDNITVSDNDNSCQQCFYMDPTEDARYSAFCEDHKNCMRNSDGSHRYGTIGGGISVEFMPTGLGNIIQCKCHTCGKIVDITNTLNW